MEMKIRVYCQYFENYGWYDNTADHWKCKGGEVFIFYVDGDDWFYAEDKVKFWFENRILPNHCNSAFKYEARNYEIADEETIITEKFDFEEHTKKEEIN